MNPATNSIASSVSGLGIRNLTKAYEHLLLLVFALLPGVAAGYLHSFQDPSLRLENHLFHELAIAISILLSSFITYVTWRCYMASGEVFLRWLTLAFLGFAIVYAPHGLLTRAAHDNIWLFLLFGPASRLVMGAFLFIGLLHYGTATDPEAERGRGARWWPWIVAMLAVDAAVAVLANSPVAGNPMVRYILEGGAIFLAVLGMSIVLARHARSPLMMIHLLALACFTQSSAAFLLARPWNHLWWVAHAIFAGGFFLLSHGVVRAFHTTNSFAAVFSQEEMMTRLAAAKAAAEETLETLQQTQATLIETEKMAALGGLVAGIAHEINTPVGIALSAATHLEAETEKTRRLYAQEELGADELEDYFNTAVQASRLMVVNSRRAADLIQSFKQVAVDQTAGERRVFDLKSYLDEILLSLRPQLRKAGHKVILDCPEGLSIDGNPGALSHCLTNLLTNSVIHGYPPGVTGTIRIDVTAPDADRIELVYADDGVGIPPETQGKVFEPFFTTRRGAGGSGLGLHILYNAVHNALKGTVRLHSVPGQGTRFLITFPRSLGAAPSSAPVAKENA